MYDRESHYTPPNSHCPQGEILENVAANLHKSPRLLHVEEAPTSSPDHSNFLFYSSNSHISLQGLLSIHDSLLHKEYPNEFHHVVPAVASVVKRETLDV